MGSPYAIRCNARAGGTITLMARVENHNAQPITRATVEKLAFAIYLLDPEDANRRTPIIGFEYVEIDKNAVVFDELQTDAIWTKDGIGYNLKHTIDDRVYMPFVFADREYLVEFEITSDSGPVILVPFVVRTVKDAS